MKPFVILTLMVSGGVGCSFADQPGDILMGRNDPAGTGANLNESILTPAAFAAKPFGRLWSYPVAGFVYAQPLVVSSVKLQGSVRDLLIVATTANQVCAFDITSSSPKPIWRRDLTPGAAGDSSTCAPSPPSKLLWGLQRDRPILEPNFTNHLAPTVGVLSTPVIDATTGLLYVVSRVVTSNLRQPAHTTQTLSAISVQDGSIVKSAPIGPGVNVSTAAGAIAFDPVRQINRPGLALVNNLVIVMWGAFLDGYTLPRVERGWVTAFDKKTLGLKGVFCSTCFDKGLLQPLSATSPLPRYRPRTGGMIWQSGRPPAAWDDRYVYFMTGNALDPAESGFDDSCHPAPGEQRGVGDYSESLVVLDTSAADKWSSNQGVSSWSPADWCQLDHDDNDLGGSGPMLLPTAKRTISQMLVPGPPLAFGGGKAGILYSIDTGKISGPGMAEWSTPSARAVLQCVNVSPNIGATGGNLAVQNNDAPNVCNEPENSSMKLMGNPPHHTGGITGHIMGGPVFLPDLPVAVLPTSTEATGTLFVAPENMPVLAYRVVGGVIQPGPVAKSAADIGSGHPGGILSLTANAKTAGSAIIWVSHHLDPPGTPLGGDANNNSQTTMMKGALQALDAATLKVLWSSQSPDAKGGWDSWYQKFTPPTVSHGKVFLCVAPQSPTTGGPYNAATGDGQVVVLGFQR